MRRIASGFLSLRERTEVRVNGIGRESHHRLWAMPRSKGTLILTFSLREKELRLRLACGSIARRGSLKPIVDRGAKTFIRQFFGHD